VRLAFSVGVIINLFTSSIAGAASAIEVKVAPPMREYCHIMQFPHPWAVLQFDEHGKFLGNFMRDYEFRIPGELRTRFLMAGVVDAGFEEQRRYTTNKYEVDLSDPKASVRPASDEAWKSATVITLSRKPPLVVAGRREKPIEFHGFVFTQSGGLWALDNSLLSPDQSWLVLQSWTGRAGTGGGYDISLDWGFFFGYKGKVFFDIFNADTGRKLMTIRGRYESPDPDTVLSETAWVTERYFIVPMGEHQERCLVCDFGRSGRKQGAKP
jgi:hypothetical protein